MFGDITRVGANFHAMESLANLKRVNGSIGQVQSRLSSGKRINSLKMIHQAMHYQNTYKVV